MKNSYVRRKTKKVPLLLAPRGTPSFWWKKPPVGDLGGKIWREKASGHVTKESFCLARDRVKNEIKIETSAPFSAFLSACGLGWPATLSGGRWPDCWPGHWWSGTDWR